MIPVREPENKRIDYDNMVKRTFIIAFLLLASFRTGWGMEKGDVETLIQKAESVLTEIDKNTGMKKFYQADSYSDALLHIIYARNQLEDGLYNSAYFYANLSIIKLEIASVAAEAVKYEYDLIVKQRDSCMNISKARISGDVFDAMLESGFEKKGDVYRTQFLDEYIFSKKRTSLDNFGKERIDRIIYIMSRFPKCSATIVSHSAEYDARDYTGRKASVVADYFTSKGISAVRLKGIGLGNREAMETNLGYRKADRIEIILRDITP